MRFRSNRIGAIASEHFYYFVPGNSYSNSNVKKSVFMRCFAIILPHCLLLVKMIMSKNI